MSKEIFISIGCALLSLACSAQQDIDSVLASVAKNNKTLQAQVKYQDAQKLKFRTGNTLYDPTVSYDYMRGSPNNIAGNQTDINVIQSFDFPSVYGKKKKLADEQARQADHYQDANRQDILLEAKKICIELVYRNKLQAAIKQRKARTEKFVKDFQTRLDKGEGNILDVNKARLQLIEISKQDLLNHSAINQLNQKLTELNGGRELVFADTLYPAHNPIPDFETLESEIEKNDPVKKYLEQQTVIAQKQVGVTKALALPRFEAGYHYQGILGQNFHGGKIGMSIPLWENRNRVKQREAEVHVTEGQLNDHRNEHYYDIRQLYEKFSNLQKTVAQYRQVLNSINSIKLLEKALAFGEITTIQYFLEAGYFYDAINNYLLAEKEYNEVIAELYKYLL